MSVVKKQESATFEQEQDANSALSDLDRGMDYHRLRKPQPNLLAIVTL